MPDIPLPDVKLLDTEQIRWLRSALDADGARRAAVDDIVSYEVRRATPDGGALLHIDWVDPNKSTIDWFADLGIARRALKTIAESLGNTIYNDGFSFDMSGPDSPLLRAWLEER